MSTPINTVAHHDASHAVSTNHAEIAAQYLGFDHVRFWVGNALQASQWYTARFGFEYIAYQGLETGERKVATHVIRMNDVYFAFSSALYPGNKEMGDHQERHGDGVRDVAFRVDDARAAYEDAIARGGVSVLAPTELKDEHGTVVIATIQAYNDTVHSFVQRSGYTGVFLPGYKDMRGQHDPLSTITPPPEYLYIDHIVGNHDDNMMLKMEEWYKTVLNFHRFWSVDDKQIHTNYSSLRSVVMSSPSEKVKMPQNEPAEGIRKSQIKEFVEHYGGSGVQHIALRTTDIVHTVSTMVGRGVKFLTVPDTYYDDLIKRLSHTSLKVKEDLATLQKLNILVDFDDKGYLLQIFTNPVEDRPTLFFEIIQRENNDGFGVGNFKALFESIERAQALRGNL